MNEHAVRLALEVAVVTKDRDQLAAQLDHVRELADEWINPPSLGAGVLLRRQCGIELLAILDDGSGP